MNGVNAPPRRSSPSARSDGSREQTACNRRSVRECPPRRVRGSARYQRVNESTPSLGGRRATRRWLTAASPRMRAPCSSKSPGCVGPQGFLHRARDANPGRRVVDGANAGQCVVIPLDPFASFDSAPASGHCAQDDRSGGGAVGLWGCKESTGSIRVLRLRARKRALRSG
jgi:hypothetical protein